MATKRAAHLENEDFCTAGLVIGTQIHSNLGERKQLAPGDIMSSHCWLNPLEGQESPITGPHVGRLAVNRIIKRFTIEVNLFYLRLDLRSSWCSKNKCRSRKQVQGKRSNFNKMKTSFSNKSVAISSSKCNRVQFK